MSKLQTKGNIKYFIFLHILLAVYSLSGICAKLASAEEFLSVKFCLFYGCIILILGIYALCWQQILKHLPLTTAFCNKAVSIIWGILWGTLFFNETIKWNMVLGGIIVIIGVILVVTSDEQE